MLRVSWKTVQMTASEQGGVVREPSYLQPIRDGHVVYKGDTYNYPTNVDLSQLMPENMSDYWRYEGSLTTPPCSEAVIWTVFHDTLNISHDQAEFLMNNLYHGPEDDDHHNEVIKGNYRPIMPLNGRVVSTSVGVN
jgi:carbonic anhydrase